MVHISKALAPLEKTDGMRLSELVIETVSEIPRDEAVFFSKHCLSTSAVLAIAG